MKKKVLNPLSLGCLGVLVIGGLLGYALLNMREWVKYAGAPFMVIPEALGLIETVKEDEVQLVQGIPRYSDLEIESAGSYLVYLPSWQQTEGITEVTIRGDLGEIPLHQIERGKRPYDTLSTNGFPKYSFTIGKPGTYRIHISNRFVSARDVAASIVPDYITGNEMVFIAVIVIQILFILFIVGLLLYIYRQRRRKQFEAQVAQQEAREAEFDDFYRKQSRKDL